MVNTVRCPKCGSDRIMSDVKIVDHGHLDTRHNLSIEFHRNPNAWVLKGTQKGVLLADVCGQCGHIELSVGNPAELWELYERNKPEAG